MIRLLKYFGWMPFVWFGGQDAFFALIDRAPAQMELAQYAQNRPWNKWLELSNCYVNYLDAARVVSGRTRDEKAYYVPLRLSESDESPVNVVLKLNEPSRIALLRRIANSGAESATAITLEHASELFGTETVKGMIQYGYDIDDKDRETLKTAGWRLADNYVILEQNKKRELGLAWGLFSVIAGLLWGGAVVRHIFRKLRAASAATPRPNRQGVEEDSLNSGSPDRVTEGSAGLQSCDNEAPQTVGSEVGVLS